MFVLWGASAALFLLGCDDRADDAVAGGAGAPAAPVPRCVTALEPDFRLRFEEIALDDEPQEVTAFAFVPDATQQLLMLDKQGRLRLYELAEEQGRLVGKVELANVYGDDDCGAVSLAFDPDFHENRFVYVGHCLTPKSSRITRLSLASDLSGAAASAQTIIDLGDERAGRPWHNVGSLGFDDASVMWAEFGDKTVTSNSQDLSVALGKLLRIIPSREPDGGGYRPAEGNDALAAEPSVYARGLRSPWKGARDHDGRYWVADVGSDKREELNLIAAPGDNLGWPLAEGPCVDNCDGLKDPLVSYGRETDNRYALEDSQTGPTNARAIWVAGPLASTSESDPYACNLNGLMLFGDYFTGWVRAVAADSAGRVALDRQLGHLVFASAFAQDQSGVLYATTLGVYKDRGTDPRGRLYRAVAARATK